MSKHWSEWHLVTSAQSLSVILQFHHTQVLPTVLNHTTTSLHNNSKFRQCGYAPPPHTHTHTHTGAWQEYTYPQAPFLPLLCRAVVTFLSIFSRSQHDSWMARHETEVMSLEWHLEQGRARDSHPTRHAADSERTEREDTARCSVQTGEGRMFIFWNIDIPLRIVLDKHVGFYSWISVSQLILEVLHCPSTVWLY